MISTLTSIRLRQLPILGFRSQDAALELNAHASNPSVLLNSFPICVSSSTFASPSILVFLQNSRRRRHHSCTFYNCVSLEQPLFSLLNSSWRLSNGRKEARRRKWKRKRDNQDNSTPIIMYQSNCIVQEYQDYSFRNSTWRCLPKTNIYI
jgi:hypothetical protein